MAQRLLEGENDEKETGEMRGGQDEIDFIYPRTSKGSCGRYTCDFPHARLRTSMSHLESRVLATNEHSKRKTDVVILRRPRRKEDASLHFDLNFGANNQKCGDCHDIIDGGRTIASVLRSHVNLSIHRTKRSMFSTNHTYIRYVEKLTQQSYTSRHMHLIFCTTCPPRCSMHRVVVLGEPLQRWTPASAIPHLPKTDLTCTMPSPRTIGDGDLGGQGATRAALSTRVTLRVHQPWGILEAL